MECPFPSTLILHPLGEISITGIHLNCNDLLESQFILLGEAKPLRLLWTPRFARLHLKSKSLWPLGSPVTWSQLT